jgi:O-antigen/teichoic acid export membrane protein
VIIWEKNKIRGINEMIKAMQLGKDSASGSFKLFIGKIISTIILAVGTIILGLYLEDSGYGLYSIALIPITTALLFQDWGVNSAITRTCANLRSKNETGNLRKTILAGFAFESVTGGILTIVTMLTATLIATSVYNKPESAPLLSIASIAIVCTSLLFTSQAIFVGFERMGIYSCVLIFQALCQCVLIPLLVFLGYGALGAIIAYTFSFAAACLVSVLLVYFKIYRKLGNHSNSTDLSLYSHLKPLLSYGFPLAISTILAGLLGQVCSLIMGSVVDLATIGSYRVALNFAVLLTFFTTPITTVMFPTFSKIDPVNEKSMLRSVFASSVKYTSLLLIPATFAMIILAQPIIGIIYGARYALAPSFLGLYAAGGLLALFGLYSLTSFFSALGETKFLLKLSIISLAIGIPLAVVLIPQFGIFGLIITSIMSELPLVFAGAYWAWKKYGANADLKSSGKIFLAAIISAGLTYYATTITQSTYVIQLILGASIFVIAYIVFCPLVGAITQADINNLREILSGMGVFLKILQIPLEIMGKIQKLISNIQFSIKKHFDMTN